MNLTVEFLNRDNTERTVWPWRKVSVVRYSKSAFGGPLKAVLRAYGNILDLWEFMEMLRCPVTITDQERAKAVWWGYINKVTINTNGEERSASLDGMANNIAVGYTLSGFDGKTAYSANAASVAEYGTKDLLLTIRDRTDTQAQVLRDTELGRRKYPSISLPTYAFTRVDYAEIECLGWYEAFSWRYYSQDEGEQAYTDLDSWYGREIGEDERPQCAQEFILTSTAGWTADTIWLRITKRGSPTDNIVIRLKADNAGEPAAGDLATCTLAHTAVGNYMSWVECTLSAPVALSTGTSYWISAEKSGAISTANFYILDGNASRGANGDFMLNWDTGGWKDKTTMHMNYRVTGKTATTAQIGEIVTESGQFLVTSDIVDASGVNVPKFRDGDNTAMYEINELLNIGTTSNLRLLARVLENRHLEVYEEPPQFEADYSRDTNGIIRDNLDVVVPNVDCPVGAWMKFESNIPSSVDTSKLINADYVFVEEAEYIADGWQYRIIRTRDVDPLNDLFGVKDG